MWLVSWALFFFLRVLFVVVGVCWRVGRLHAGCLFASGLSLALRALLSGPVLEGEGASVGAVALLVGLRPFGGRVASRGSACGVAVAGSGFRVCFTVWFL